MLYRKHADSMRTKQQVTFFTFFVMFEIRNKRAIYLPSEATLQGFS